MISIGEIWRRFAMVLRRGRAARELDEEMRVHREARVAELVAAGMGEEEARCVASRAFGNASLLNDESREAWGWIWVEELAGHLRLGFRLLRKSPGFAIVAILTLALGIGANTAIFGLVNATLLQPLPFPDPDQLVRVFSTRGGERVDPSPLDARDMAAENHTFESMAINDTWRKSVSGLPDTDAPEQQMVGIVQSAWFSVLRIRPIIGEVWTPSADEPGRNYVAVLGEKFWRDRYHADPHVIGRIVKVNEEPYTIIGVVPDAVPAWFYRDVPVWTPFVANPRQWQEFQRGNRGYWVVGRMKPGVSIAQAQADLRTVAASLAARYPADRDISAVLSPLTELRTGKQKTVLLMLVGAVGLVLLITCANLANLLLARNTARHREFAVRAAIGAGRRVLVRMMLAESILLAFLGGALGLLLAYGASVALIRYHPAQVPQLSAGTLDWRVLLFTFLVCLATAILFGALPAITGSRVNLSDALREGGRSGMAGMRGQRARQTLVISEVALALMLLATTGLLVRSILRMEKQDLGFPTDHLLTARFFLPSAYRAVGADGSETITRFADEVTRRVSTLPGVKQSTITAAIPPEDRWPELFTVVRHPAATIAEVPETRLDSVDFRYRATLGIRLVQGRDFQESDTETTMPAALINETMARNHFGGESPIGQQVYMGEPLNLRPQQTGIDGNGVERFTVVGVLADTKNDGLALGVQPQIIILFRQAPVWNFGYKRITLRTNIEPHQLAETLRREIQLVNPDSPVTNIETMDERVEELDASNRFSTTILGLMAALGVALSIVGIYGVISYLVAQRAQEFGVRLALGATPRNIVWMTVRQGLRMTVVGALAGLTGTVAIGGAMVKLLYEISPMDPVSLGMATGTLLLVGLLACAVPAYRAMGVDPMVTLRHE
jgi:predicted permease